MLVFRYLELVALAVFGLATWYAAQQLGLAIGTLSPVGGIALAVLMLSATWWYVVKGGRPCSR